MVMDEKLEDAAKYGDLVSFVEEARNNEIESGCSEEYFLSQTSLFKENILHLAIRYDQNEFIEKVLKGGELLPKAVTDELIKQQDSFGDTPLHDAARENNVHMFRLVLEYDSQQAKVKNENGKTPLHVAVMSGTVENARLLIEQHPELASVIDNDGNTILHLAVDYGRVEIARLLIEQHPELASVTDKDGNTILHVAVENGRVEIARLLIEQHPELASVTHNDGNTILHVAVKSFEIETAKLLLEHHHEMTSATNNFKETPLHLAINNYKQTISDWKVLTDYEQRSGTTSDTKKEMNELTRWLEDNKKEMNKLTKLLLEKDKNVACMQDNEKKTPLHRAVDLVQSFGVEVVNMIIKCCPDSAKVKDGSGRTILHYMIECVTSYKTSKEFLKLEGINDVRSYKDNAGDTPLDLAWKINIKMARALLDSPLLDHSASPDAVAQKINDLEMIRKRRKTMEEYGVVDGVHLQFLKSKLSKFRNDFLFSRDSNGRNLLHNLMQLERGSPVDFEEFYNFILEVVYIQPKLVCQTDHNRDTPVHILMRNSLHTKILVKSSESKFSISGKTIQTLGHSRLVNKLIDLCCKYFHIAKGANTKGNFKYGPPWMVQNVDGNTPLHEAIKANHTGPILVTLSKLEIETTAKLTNKHNETPLHLLAETPLHLLAGCSNDTWPEEVIVDLVKANPKAALNRDENGLTPMLRAIQVFNISTFNILFGLYFGAGDQMDAQLYKDIEEAKNDYLVEEKDNIISGFAEEMAHEKDRIQSKTNKIKAHQYDLAEQLLTDNSRCTLWHMLLPTKAENLVDEDLEIKLLMHMLKEADKEGVPQLIERLEEADKDRKMQLELIDRLVHGDKEGKTLLQLIERLQEGDKEGKTLLQFINRLQEGDKEGKTLSQLIDKLLKESDKWKNMPSHMIELFKEDYNEGITPSHMIELLNEANNKGITPSHVIELLKEAEKQGKKPWHLIRLLKVADKQGKTLSQLTELLEKGDDKHGKMLLSHLIELLNEAQYHLAKKLLSDNNGCTLWHMLLNQPPSKVVNLVEDIEIKLLIQMLKEAHKEGVPQLIKWLTVCQENGKTLKQLIAQLEDGDKEGKMLLQLIDEQSNEPGKKGKMLLQSIELLKKGDEMGKTPSHMRELLNEADKEGKMLLLLLTKLLKEANKERKTALHLALERQHFIHAHYFLKCLCSFESKERSKEMMKELLYIKDGNGKTPSDLLASFTELPEEFHKFLEDNASLVGIRSFWDVPTTKIGEVANTMSVVAALITTITFTAAFTVPGGLVEGNKGFPLLIKKAAFQVFMVSDISAMWLSVMVLSGLFWVIATTDKSKSVVLLDSSLILLLLSLYATVVSFMMGVYVTTIDENPWIAIITIILCSSLMLIMTTMFMVPVVKILKWYWRHVGHLGSDAL